MSLNETKGLQQLAHQHNVRQLLAMSWSHMQYIEEQTTKALIHTYLDNLSITVDENFTTRINQGWWGYAYLCGPLGSSMWGAVPYEPSKRNQQGVVLRRSNGFWLVIPWIEWINILEAGEVIDTTRNDKYLIYSVSEADKQLVHSTFPNQLYSFETERSTLYYVDTTFDFPIGLFSVKDNVTFYFDWVPLNNLTKKVRELLFK